MPSTFAGEFSDPLAIVRAPDSFNSPRVLDLFPFAIVLWARLKIEAAQPLLDICRFGQCWKSSVRRTVNLGSTKLTFR